VLSLDAMVISEKPPPAHPDLAIKFINFCRGQKKTIPRAGPLSTGSGNQNTEPWFSSSREISDQAVFNDAESAQTPRKLEGTLTKKGGRCQQDLGPRSRQVASGRCSGGARWRHAKGSSGWERQEVHISGGGGIRYEVRRTPKTENWMVQPERALPPPMRTPAPEGARLMGRVRVSAQDDPW